MKLKDQMFTMIDDWYASKLHKKEFLVDRSVSQAKFDYLLKKYHNPNHQSKKVSKRKVTQKLLILIIDSISTLTLFRT